MTTASLNLQVSPFADDFIDVAELNAHVSNTLLARLQEVRSGAARAERVGSKAYCVLGPAGVGKTHLLGRIRQSAGPHATMVLLRPHFGVSLSLRDVLAAIIDQLCRRTRDSSLTQLDLVLSHWLVPAQSSTRSFPSASALEAKDLPAEERSARIEDAVARVVDRIPELAPVAHLVRAFLSVGGLERSALWTELAWLSGREPRPGATNGEATPLGERDVLHVLTMVAMLAGPVAPIVLTFDQLENLANEGEQRVLGYGNVLSELVDSVPYLTIVQLALTSEWLQFIETNLSLPQRTRIAHEKLLLEIPAEKERRQLLRTWHERLVPNNSSRRKKRNPLPFSDAELNELLTAPGLTPRMLAVALTRVLAGKPMAEPTSEHANGSTSTSAASSLSDVAASPSSLTDLFEAERIRVLDELADKERTNAPIDAGDLAEALAAALSYGPKLDLETRSERERLQTLVRAPGGELTIVYLTSNHHGSVAASLTRAAEMARTGKVAVLREKRFDFPSSWSAVEEKRAAFERLPNARWLWLDRDETARLLTLARLSSLARAQRLRCPTSDEPRSLEWVRERAPGELTVGEWTAVSSVARWLADVPREARTPVADESPRSKSRNNPDDEPSELLTSLREWAKTGRSLGKAAIRHYWGKFRRR